MIFRSDIISILSSALYFLFLVTDTVAWNLMIPPSLRIKFGGEEALRLDCETFSKSLQSLSFHWALDVTQGYQVPTIIFQIMSNFTENLSTIWFPNFGDSDSLEAMASVISANSNLLQGIQITTQLWPTAPCHGIQISSSNRIENIPSETDQRIAIQATEAWVDNVLCGLKLCPHTLSLSRAAVGLEAASIPIGPIGIRTTPPSSRVASAILITASFWTCVTELMTTPESDLATILLLAPPEYDANFQEFIAVCDNLIEATIRVFKADEWIGKAWFHPLYNCADIGHVTILPGHALPATMVQQFMIQAHQESEGKFQVPAFSDIAQANDEVRRTPHATINLLRRSQLQAAKRIEASSPNKKPNSIYVRNVNKILKYRDLNS
jgi:hypothetical protein